MTATKTSPRRDASADSSGTAPRDLLTVEAAAARLSISRTRMYALIRTGDVTSVRIGRLRRIPTTELAAFTARLLATQTAA